MRTHAAAASAVLSRPRWFWTRGKGTPDIFVHMETLRQCGLIELRPGQVVLVRFGHGPKGLMAAEVRPENSSLGTAVH